MSPDAEPWVRFGGELPLDCDPLRPAPEPLPPEVLGFSHGRAALGWLIRRRGPFAAALVCAYTCPSVPEHLRGFGLRLGFYEFGAGPEAVLAAARALPAPRLVLVPAPFGFRPWLDAAILARELGERALVVVDAAQSAFAPPGPPPPGGARFWCPRKTTALGDGACLELAEGGAAEREAVAALPEAEGPAQAKLAARALFAARDPAREAAALALAGHSEQSWPATPHRMSRPSREALPWLDPVAHAVLRQANHRHLSAALAAAGLDWEPGYRGAGVPFCLPLLVPGGREPRTRLLAALRVRRVFATPLWPGAEHDPAAHPRAASLAAGLLALPVDQRYRAADMERLAALVAAAAREQGLAGRPLSG